jgi:hypothetical protein
MTVQEWDSFVKLYRQTWKVHADLATLRTTLTMAKFAAQQDQPEMVAG